MHLHKYAIGGIAVAVVAVVLVGWTTMRSYFNVAIDDARQAIKDAEPPEMKLKRARAMLKDIDPAMNRNKHVIAVEEVAVEDLAKRVETKQAELVSLEGTVRDLAAHMESGKQYRTVGKTYTSDEVKTSLSNKIQLCKQVRSTVNALQSQLNAKQRSLAAVKAQLSQLVTQKDQLRARIDELEAKLANVKVAESVSNVNIDGSELANLNELLNDINANVRVREKMVEGADVPVEDVPVGAPSEQDLSKQVNEYFKESAPAPVTVEEGPNT